jgi:hypothetical protein
MLQSGKNFNSHHRAGSHWTTGLKIQSILLIFLTLFGIFQLAASPSQAQAAGTANLLQKTITWGDGTVETVVIDSNGNFILNGAQTKLVGFCDSMIYAHGVPYDTDNMALLNKELDYLQGKGVRLYQVNLWLWGEDAYDGLLQMFYDHKMLVVPLFSGTGESNFGDLTTTDFVVDSTGTISTFFAAWLKHVKSFQNVVSIIIENELDIQMSGSSYTLSNVTKYMDMLYNYAKANTTLPILTKFGVLNYDANAASVQNAFLHYSAIPAFDLYYTDATSFGSGCTTTSNWYSTKTSVSQMWVTEANYAYAREPGYYNATKFTKDMVDAMFSHNVSAVFLFAVQDKYDSSAMFFDTLGNPIANTEVLMANMAVWQAPVTPAPVVLAVPTLSSPANAATVSNVTPTLSWNPSAGASTYSLQVSANTTFSPTVVNQNALTGSSYSIPAGVLSQGVTYNWRVAAKDANSNTSAWSSVFTFKTPVAVQAPTLASPANASTVSNVTPTLSWNPSAGASTYSLQVSSNSTFSSTVINQTTLAGTSYSISAGVLSQGTTYNWRVSAKDANSNISTWSSVYTFKTPVAASTLKAPTLSSPVNKANITDLTPSLTWNGVTGAASYCVQLSTDTTFATTIVNKSAITRTSYTIPLGTLSWSTTYYWRVCTTDKSGLNSTWSTAYSMTTSTNPFPAAASNLMATVKSSSQASLSWKDNSSNESGFKIERKTETGAYAIIATTKANVVWFNDTGLKARTTYIYRVTAYNAIGAAAPSNEVTIITTR